MATTAQNDSAELARLREENERLRAKATAATAIKFKVGSKGGVSVYGINARFPVTLYADQWERLIEAVPELQAFIAENEHRLSRKGDS